MNLLISLWTWSALLHCFWSARQGKRTRNGLTGIDGILVLNESESIHEFGLENLASSVIGEVSLNVRLGGCMVSRSVSAIQTTMAPLLRVRDGRCVRRRDISGSANVRQAVKVQSD